MASRCDLRQLTGAPSPHGAADRALLGCTNGKRDGLETGTDCECAAMAAMRGGACPCRPLGRRVREMLARRLASLSRAALPLLQVADPNAPPADLARCALLSENLPSSMLQYTGPEPRPSGSLTPWACRLQECKSNKDCQSNQCLGRVCAFGPTCNNGITDADETDVDCGGIDSGCLPCCWSECAASSAPN